MSAKLSPFLTLEPWTESNPTIFPPDFSTAEMKLSFVLVLGSKKSVATTFPSKVCEYFSGFFSMSLANSNNSRKNSFGSS